MPKVCGPSTKIVLLIVALIVVGVLYGPQLYALATGGNSASGAVADVSPDGLAAALSSGKPGVLEFYTTWCTYCRQLEPELEKLATAYSDRVFVVRMNAEKYPAESTKYNVDGVPMLVYFDASGNLIHQAAGFLPYNDLVQTLKDLKIAE